LTQFSENKLVEKPYMNYSSYDNTTKTHARKHEITFEITPAFPNDQTLNFIKIIEKPKIEKISPQKNLRENRENFALIKKFGNKHYRTTV